ncbi:lysophospholipid acyltransferase family protein [Paraburkholderia solisilvae]|nr:lysophospholipid acyltransferase family protein [Paraburkholderia solisilvae]
MQAVPLTSRAWRRPIHSWLRIFILLFLHFVFAFVVLLAIYPFVNTDGRMRLYAHWCRKFLKITGVTVFRFGSEIADRGSLLVANHVSLLDVYVLNSCHPASSLAKKEVRKWPVVGWMASRLETVFIDRSNKRQVIECIVEISEKMRSRISFWVFPEGTRSRDGVKKFRSAIFQAAIDSSSPVYPVSVFYPSMSKTSNSEFDAQESDFKSILKMLHTMRRPTVYVFVGAAIGGQGKRDEYAAWAEQAVKEGYERLRVSADVKLAELEANR